MKKLVSLLSAVAMLAMLAVPASAALTYAPDEDGWYVIESAPTDAEVAAYAPTLKATATKLTTTEELTAISSAVNKKYKNKLTTHDIYKVTYDMADIGKFVNGYDADYNNAFFGLYDITIGFDTAGLPEGYETYALTYTLPDGSTGAVGVGVDQVTGILNAAYTAAGVAYDTIFPARTNDEGIVVDAGTYKAEFILAYPTTTEQVTLPFSQAKITYKTTVGSANSAPATTNVTCDDIVLGEVIEEPKDMVVTYDNAKRFDLDINDDTVADGYAWEVLVTNYDSTKTLSAKFTDAETGLPRAGKEKTEITGLAAAAETDGSISFVALLQLSQARNVNFEIVVE